MGAFVPLANGVQVEIVHLLDGVGIENRLWFTFDNPPYTAADVAGLTDGVASWWSVQVLPYLSQDIFTGFVQATDWTTAGNMPYPATIIDLPGGVASESCSANVAVVVPFRWPLGVRLKQNKHFVAGCPEAEVTLNTVSLSFSDHLFDAYVSLIDDTRRFEPRLNWRWRATSAYENGVARSTQLAYDVQGVDRHVPFLLGQRRTRLPA